MKALLLTIMTVALFFSAFHADKISTAAISIYRDALIDQLDPSWPRLA